MKYHVLAPVVLLLQAAFVSGLAAAPPTASQEPQPTEEFTEDDLAKLTAEIEKEVEALRGRKFKHHVKVGLYTTEGLRAFLGSEGPEHEEGWGESSRSTVSLKMVGVVPQDADPSEILGEAMTTFVPGIYDHRTKTLGIVQREGVDCRALHMRTVIAHELVHALDDQYFDLEKLMAERPTSDAEFALGAVMEGSAVVLQTRYEQQAKRAGDYDAAKHKEAIKSEMAQMRTLFEAPPFVAMFLARFPNGVRFVLRGDMKAFATVVGLGDSNDADGFKGVADAVRIGLTDVPRSSEQILHLEKYWRSEQQDEPVTVNDQDVDKLLATQGFHVVHRDTIGELLCAVVTSAEDKKINPMAMPMPGYWTNAAATGWGGDRFFLLATEPVADTAERQPETLYGLWLTMWDTAQDRDEFIDAYDSYRPLPSRSLFKLGKLGAVYFFGFDETRRKALEKRLQSAPPECVHGDASWSFDGR